MNLKQLTSRIFVLPFDEALDRPNLYYVRGDRCSAAIDAGSSPAHVGTFYRCLKAQGLPAPSYTVLTHWHWDHTFGLCAVSGLTVASALTNAKLREVGKWQWMDEAMLERERTGEDIAFCNEHIRLEYPDLSAIRVVPAQMEVADSLALDLGGVTLTLTARDSAHSRDALFVYSPEERALFAGDADCGDLYDCGGNYDPDRLRSMTDLYRSIDYDLHLIGHDEPDTKRGIINYLGAILTAME